MSVPLNPSGQNTTLASSSTKLDTNAIKLEMGEIQEILRGLQRKGCLISVKPRGEVVVLVVITPGHSWEMKEINDQISLALDGENIVPAEEK